jgi:hypothetical protein
VTCLHTNSPGHISTTLYFTSVFEGSSTSVTAVWRQTPTRFGSDVSPYSALGRDMRQTVLVPIRSDLSIGRSFSLQMVCNVG